jgi:hypothetical protein
MALIDSIRAELTCAYCGQSTAATRTGIQTKVRDDPTGRELAPGDPVGDCDIGKLLERGYVLVRTPALIERVIQVAESWECAHCGLSGLALLHLANGRLETIESPISMQGVFNRTHCISTDALVQSARALKLETRGKTEMQLSSSIVALYSLLAP